MRDGYLGLGARRLTPGYNIAGFQPEDAAPITPPRQRRSISSGAWSYATVARAGSCQPCSRHGGLRAGIANCKLRIES